MSLYFDGLNHRPNKFIVLKIRWASFTPAFREKVLALLYYFFSFGIGTGGVAGFLSEIHEVIPCICFS